MISMLFGIVAAACGLWGIFTWWNELLLLLKGLLPISLFFSGIVALIVGVSRLNAPPPKTKDDAKT